MTTPRPPATRTTIGSLLDEVAAHETGERHGSAEAQGAELLNLAGA